MENNPLPIADSPQTTNAVGQASLTMTQPSTVDSRPNANNFLVVLLSVLLFISVSIAGFFAYQTQMLVKELMSLKSSPSPVVQVSTEPTIEPTSVVRATSDPTADWKTYTNTKDGYTLKYPSNLGLIFLDCSKGLNSYNFVLADKENTGCYAQGEGWIINSEGSSDCASTEAWKSVSERIKINDLDAIKCTHTFIGEQMYPGPINRINVTFIKDGKYISFDLKDLKYVELFDQILSTFKFTN